MSGFVKSDRMAPECFYEAEAAGLEWLGAADGARVARVLAVGPGRIELERIPEASPTREAARAFGSALATTHAAGADAFGAPPDGWTGPCFIGSRGQECRPEASWGRFYAAQRVLPFAAIASDAGTIDEGGLAILEEVCGAVSEGAFDDDEPPARLHGDLWAGNVLWSADGAVLIDPAAHGGHRETDLAMLHLFGLPRLDEVIAAYDAAAPLRPGWRDRIPLHQLHPLAVHAAGHGPSHGAALIRAAEAARALVP